MIKLKRISGGLSEESTTCLLQLIEEGTVSMSSDHYWVYFSFYNPEDELSFKLKYEHTFLSEP